MTTCAECSKWKKRTRLEKGDVGVCKLGDYDIMTFSFDTCKNSSQKTKKKRLTRKELDARDV